MSEMLLKKKFVELPAPHYTPQQLALQILIHKVSTPFCLLALLFYILQVFTDIQIGREVLILSVVLGIVTYLKYSYNIIQTHARQLVFWSILITCGGVVMVFWQFGYQIITLTVQGGFIIWGIWNVFQECKNRSINTMNKGEFLMAILRFILLFGYLYLFPLTDSGLITIPWALLLLPVFICLICFNILSFLKYIIYFKAGIFEPIVEIFPFKQIIMHNFTIVMTINLTSLSIISKLYFPTFIYVLFLLLSFLLDTIVLYFIWRFPEQTCLFLCYCHIQDPKSLFRVHERQFAASYDFDTCNRVVNWNENIRCLTCQNRATFVNLKCGHISACITCQQKLQRKRYIKCIICGISNDYITSFYHKIEHIKYGYRKGLTVEVKLLRNQYVRVLPS